MPGRLRRFTVALTALAIACEPVDEPATHPEQVSTAEYVVVSEAEAIFGREQVREGYDLSRLSTVHLLRDGRVAVLSSDSKIRIHAPDGTLVATYGGRGEGPGQYQMPNMTALDGDTLLVYDAGTRRASWVDPSAGEIRSVRFNGTVPFAYRVPVGVDADGSVLISTLHGFPNDFPAEPGESRTLARVAAFVTEEGLRVRFAVPDVLITPRPPPYGPPPERIPDPVVYAGVAQIRARHGIAYVLPGGDERLERWRLDGTIVDSISLRVQRRPVLEGDRTAYLDKIESRHRAQAAGPHGTPPSLEKSIAFLRGSHFADSFPAVDELFLDASSEDLWLVHGGPIEPTWWEATRIGADGAVRFSVASDLPGSRPLAFSGMHVLVAREDADGVTTLERHRIERNVIPYGQPQAKSRDP